MLSDVAEVHLQSDLWAQRWVVVTDSTFTSHSEKDVVSKPAEGSAMDDLSKLWFP